MNIYKLNSILDMVNNTDRYSIKDIIWNLASNMAISLTIKSVRYLVIDSCSDLVNKSTEISVRRLIRNSTENYTVTQLQKQELLKELSK